MSADARMWVTSTPAPAASTGVQESATAPTSQQPESGRTLARGRRRPLKRTKPAGFDLCLNLLNDVRFMSLSPTYRYTLIHAAVEYADAEGKFFPRVSTWAKATGVSEATLHRAIKEAVAAGLIQRTPHFRPNGRQGSSTYRFDDALLVAGDDVTPQAPTA